MILIPGGLIISNRFSIYLSVLFCDPPNFGGWGVKPLQPPSNLVFDKLLALENASGADVFQGHRIRGVLLASLSRYICCWSVMFFFLCIKKKSMMFA